MTPKEDPDAKKDRTRERRMAQLERKEASQQTASDLRTDVAAVYGLPSMFQMRKK